MGTDILNNLNMRKDRTSELKSRQLKIHLSELMDYIPLVIVKDPEFCFGGISTEKELDFIVSLSHEQWKELCISNFEETFDEFTQNYKDMIFEKFKSEFNDFKKSVPK